MNHKMLRLFVFHWLAVSLVSLGLTQAAFAGTVDTRVLMEPDVPPELEQLLEREDVARQLAAFGVEPDEVRERVANLSHEETRLLAERLDAQVAGGDAIGIIGVVFLVLLILELVGVTNVFTAI